MTARALLGLLALLVLPSLALATTYEAPPGRAIAAFALDRTHVAIAENALSATGCPSVSVGRSGSSLKRITKAGGPTCIAGATIAAPSTGQRELGVAIERAIWIARPFDGGALAIMGSSYEPEEVLQRVGPQSATTLGPVLAENWLRIYGVQRAGVGWITSGNRLEKWRDSTAYIPAALDAEEHVIVIGPSGALAGFHPHGARYGRVADAHARAVAVEGRRVYVLRSDRPELDVYSLMGRRLSSRKLVGQPLPLLDVDGGVVVYSSGGSAHALTVATGKDRPIMRLGATGRVLDVQITDRLVGVLEWGGSVRTGRVRVVARASALSPLAG